MLISEELPATAVSNYPSKEERRSALRAQILRKSQLTKGFKNVTDKEPND